jgi:hypothetical protein
VFSTTNALVAGFVCKPRRAYDIPYCIKSGDVRSTNGIDLHTNIKGLGLEELGLEMDKDHTRTQRPLPVPDLRTCAGIPQTAGRCCREVSTLERVKCVPAEWMTRLCMQCPQNSLFWVYVGLNVCRYVPPSSKPTSGAFGEQGPRCCRSYFPPRSRRAFRGALFDRECCCAYPNRTTGGFGKVLWNRKGGQE